MHSFKQRESNLRKFKKKEKFNRNIRKNCKTFFQPSSEKQKLTGTLKKILKNTQSSRMKRNNLSSLQSFLSTNNLCQEIPNDEEIKLKIKKNQNKLRFDRELRELYSLQTELDSISLPEFPEYFGYYFRKWYQDHAFIEKEDLEISWVSDKFIFEEENNLIDGNKWEAHTDPESMNKKRDLSIPFLPNLSDEWLKIHKDHLIESLQEYQYLNGLKIPENPPTIIHEDKISPIPNKKLLIFDMDETLIHCISDPIPSQESNFKIPWDYCEGIKYKYVNLRPFVRECLLYLSSLYQIIVFTASTQDYADPILDFLDKDKLNNGKYFVT